MWQDLGIADCGLKGRERVNESVKQSQIERSVKFEVSGSTPALGGDPSRGRLGHMAANPVRETKPIVGRGPWDCGLRNAECGLKDQQRMGEAVKQSQFALPDRWCARHTLRSGGCIARNKANFRRVDWGP